MFASCRCRSHSAKRARNHLDQQEVNKFQKVETKNKPVFFLFIFLIW
jgi:hypothetical protein